MLKNIAATTGMAVGRAAVQFMLTLTLTRFVDARDYGLIAFVTPLILLSTMLTEFGLGPALVRERELTGAQIGAAFTASCLMGLAAMLLLFGSIPVVKMFNDDPRLPAVLAALSAVPLLSLASLTPRVVLERELKYIAIARADLISILVSIPVPLALAASGAGVWALISYNVLSQAIRTVALCLNARRVLRPNWHLTSIFPLLHNSKWILAQNLQVFANRNTDNMLIGARLGSGVLGVYAFSYQFLFVPLQAFCWPIGTMLLSYLRHIGDDKERAGGLVTATLHLTAWATAPPLLALTFAARWPIFEYMRPSWRPVPDILEWFGPAAVAQCLGSYLGVLLISRGHLRANFAVGILNTISLILIFSLATRLDLMTTVRWYTGYTCAVSVFYAYSTLRLMGVRSSASAACLLPPVIVSASAALIGRAIQALSAETAITWSLSCAGFAAVVLIGTAFDRKAISQSFRRLKAAAAG